MQVIKVGQGRFIFEVANRVTLDKETASLGFFMPVTLKVKYQNDINIAVKWDTMATNWNQSSQYMTKNILYKISQV